MGTSCRLTQGAVANSKAKYKEKEPSQIIMETLSPLGLSVTNVPTLPGVHPSMGVHGRSFDISVQFLPCR